MNNRPGMKVGGKEHPVRGDMLKIGVKAPDFDLVAPNHSTRSLSHYNGKVKILSVVPSLDTSICSAQAQRFEREAEALGDDVVIITISADLPFAQKRWGEEMRIEHTFMLSTHRDMKYSDDYGVHDTEWRINQRAVFVLDQNNVVQYVEYVPVMGDEVDFDAALSKARELI
jgi:thiol peroxidase